MKASELRDKSAEQLHQDLLAALEKHFKLRMGKATGQLNQSHELKSVRRDIARIKTVINEKAGSSHD